MNLSRFVTNNVSDLLVKILEFTLLRHRILAENVMNIHTPGFVTQDLLVEEFACLMTDAITEHKRSNRLILRDTDNIRFGPNGTFEVEPVVDEYAGRLFENNTSKYLQFQMHKLLENLLNHRIATELLMQNRPATMTSGY